MEQSTAIDKALDVLFHLHAQPEPQSLGEIGRALELPKSSAHRLLAALRRRDLVEQDETGRYRPGTALLSLGLGALEREPLVAIARPVLEHAATALGETFFLVAARGGTLTVLDKVEGTGVLRASPRVGSRVPVRATAVGKLYLAHAPELVAPDLPERYTAQTIVSDAMLTREVQRAKRCGYAINRGEWIEGLGVLAAPLLLHGRLAGAVCAAVPASRLAALTEARVARKVVAAARAIEKRAAPTPAPAPARSRAPKARSKGKAA